MNGTCSHVATPVADSYSVWWLERSRLCCVLLLGLNGPWDELVAAILIGSVVGIANVSAMVNIYV